MMLSFIGTYGDTIVIVMLPAVLAAGVVFFLYARKLAASQAARRGEEMHILAMRIGFDYTSADEHGISEIIETNQAFFYGEEGEVENVISGNKAGIAVNMFDYCLSDVQKERMTICMLTLPTKVSTFSMRPLDNAEIAAGKPMELGEELFGDKYQLKCGNREFAARAFNDDLVDFLSRRRRTTALGNGNHILFHRGRFLGVRKCYSLLDFAFGFCAKMDLDSSTRPENKDSDPVEMRADLYTD
jgi:hypothetical protein